MIGFVLTNFFWWRPIPQGLASSSSGLGLPWAYERRICGDDFSGGRFKCGSFSEPEKLTWNSLVWAVAGLVIAGAVYLRKRNIS